MPILGAPPDRVKDGRLKSGGLAFVSPTNGDERPTDVADGTNILACQSRLHPRFRRGCRSTTRNRALAPDKGGTADVRRPSLAYRAPIRLEDQDRPSPRCKPQLVGLDDVVFGMGLKMRRHTRQRVSHHLVACS